MNFLIVVVFKSVRETIAVVAFRYLKLAASETCSTSQTPALNPVKKITQDQGYPLYDVNAQSLTGSFHTL